ncbi:MAG: DUF192 domain-containing protein [Solirubrobacterales bacterium]
MARTRRERLRGLAWRRRPATYGLLIERGRAVHPVGLAFRLDLVWLDGEGRTVRVDRGVAPCRFKGCRKARAVLELPSALPRRQQGNGYTSAP